MLDGETVLRHVEVLIAGGGAVGSACAHFLTRERPGISVTVIEPDPSYQHAASTLSAGSIRQQFSTPLNISLSAFGLQFLRAAGVDVVDSTYLYLAGTAGATGLRGNVQTQLRCGVAVNLLERADLSRRYPWLHTEDLAVGTDTDAGEGWFDGYSLLRHLRSENERRGVAYHRSRVTGLARANDGAGTALLEDGSRIAYGHFVNASGTHSRPVAAMLGLDLPVHARKRCVFVFTCPTRIPHCPLVIDPSGLWFRADGERFIAGLTPPEDPNVSPDDFEVDHRLFDDLLWPILAHRVPAFESVRVTGSWAGHYDYNEFDQNPFIGPAPAIPDFLFASGFSGHGLQHAPAIGRALAEWIVHGEYRSIDVAALGYDRWLQHRPLREMNVI